MTLDCLGIIPARGGSKGVVRKNIRPVAGRPLIAYTFDAVKDSRRLTRTVLTTDSPEIAEVGCAAGIEVPFFRPPELAEDTTPTLPVIQHALDWLATQESYVPDMLAILQPTAPLRRGEDIDKAIELLTTSDADSVVSVTLVPSHFNPNWQFYVEDDNLRLLTGGSPSQVLPRRQGFERTYTRNGAIYAFWHRTISQMGSIYGERCLPFIMPKERSVNIDDEVDLLMAEAMLQRRPGVAGQAL